VDIAHRRRRGACIADGIGCVIFNDRGSFAVRARVGDKAREGVVVASLGVVEEVAGMAHANEVTSQAMTDIGRGATFYDCLVEVECDPRRA